MFNANNIAAFKETTRKCIETIICVMTPSGRLPSGENRRKSWGVEKCIFDNKNALLQTVFLAILPGSQFCVRISVSFSSRLYKEKLSKSFVLAIIRYFCNCTCKSTSTTLVMGDLEYNVCEEDW